MSSSSTNMLAVLGCLAAVGAAQRAPAQVHSIISSNFNGTSITAGNTIWFNSVLDPTLPAIPGDVSVFMTGGTIKFAASGTNYAISLPDSVVTFSNSATTASTVFNSGSNRWETLLPKAFSGNAWLGGAGFTLATPLPGGINPVSWECDFHANVEGVSLNWKWAAAVYQGPFPSDYNALRVKAVDDNHFGPDFNSYHAGTPQAIRTQVIGGARGGGGSNYTGSYSGTKSASPPVPGPAAAAVFGVPLAAAAKRRRRSR